jgi:ketosteroid isomerase-like protein
MPLAFSTRVLSIALSASLAGTLCAADAPKSDARTEIEAMLTSVDRLVKSRAPVEEIAEAFYDPELLITGEGEKGLYRSRAEFMKPLESFVANGGSCVLKIVDPVRHSGNLAAAFVSEHCKGTDSKNPDSDARILYVFKKGANGWRVTMEMYGGGGV